MAKAAKTKKTEATVSEAAPARGYVHADKDMVARPEVGAAPRFRSKKAPTTYRYDSSLSPALEWDTNPARETASFLLTCIEDAARLDPPQVFAERRTLKGAGRQVAAGGGRLAGCAGGVEAHAGAIPELGR
jgi:hypothetical protein